MTTKRIVWMDDEIMTPILLPYLDEFEDQGFEVIKVESVDELLDVLQNEDSDSLSAILFDIIMPPGELDFNDTKGGLRTGIVIIETIKGNPNLKDILQIIVTNADDTAVDTLCKKYGIECLQKGEMFPKTLVKKVRHFIEGKQ